MVQRVGADVSPTGDFLGIIERNLEQDLEKPGRVFTTVPGIAPAAPCSVCDSNAHVLTWVGTTAEWAFNVDVSLGYVVSPFNEGYIM